MIGGKNINEINFTFFENYAKVIEELEEINDKKEFLLAIYSYIYKDEIPDFKGMKKIAWLGLVSSLETSKNRALGNKNKTKTKQKQSKNKTKTKQKQSKNKTKTKQKQIPSISTSTSYSNSLDNLEDRGMGKETFTNDDLLKIKDEWNEVAENGLSKITVLSKTRKDKLKLRLKEYGKDLIMDAIKKIPKSKFLLGDNDQGWKCSFDWLIENDKNILKVYEGNYESKEKSKQKEPEWLNQEIEIVTATDDEIDEIAKLLKDFR